MRAGHAVKKTSGFLTAYSLITNNWGYSSESRKDRQKSLKDFKIAIRKAEGKVPERDKDPVY